MTLGKALYDLLKTVDADVFPTNIPQGTTGDHLVYHIISATPNETKTYGSEVDTYRVQISCFSDTYAGACTLADSVRTKIDNYSGTVKGVGIDLIRFENTIDDFELETDEFSVKTDYSVRVKLYRS